MNKYFIGFLVLSLCVLGFSFSKAEAGLTNAQTQAVINLLNAFNANTATIQAVQNALLSTGNTNTTSTTSNTTSSTTPTTGGPLYAPTTPTTGGPSYAPTTPTVPSAPNNGCYSNQTSLYPYNVNNGYPCVKVCPVFTTSANIMNYWNVVTNSLCPVVNNSGNNSSANSSITIKYPNGGESFTAGDSLAVKWGTENIPDSNNNFTILLNYYDANGTLLSNSVLADHENNDGGELVVLPTILPNGAMWGNYFKVSVGTTDSNGTSLGSDFSDDYFTINQ